MATTYLFSQWMTEEKILCLVLGHDGEIIHNAKSRSFSEAIQLARESKTVIVVAPCRYFSLHYVEMPLLAYKKAEKAIPYALEEQLAQDIDDLYFAFDRSYYANGKYLVAVCEKMYLNQLIAQLEARNLEVDAMTLDWFALQINEAFVLGDGIMLNHPQFSGFTSPELEQIQLKGIDPSEITIYENKDSAVSQWAINTVKLKGKSPDWMAQRLAQKPLFRLGRTKLGLNQSKNKSRFWLKAAAAMAGIWFITLILSNVWSLLSLNAQITQVDKAIKKSYLELFPGATQVISPRFRIGQLLKDKQAPNSQTLFLLLNNVAKANQDSTVKIDQIRYQNSTLQLIVSADNFQILDKFQDELTRLKLKVKQAQAFTKDNLVNSTLELSL